MNAVTKSALTRAARTLLQFALAWVTVDRLNAAVGGLDLDPNYRTMLAGGLAALLSFLQRRYLDPSRVPSLVDGHAMAGLPGRIGHTTRPRTRYGD